MDVKVVEEKIEKQMKSRYCGKKYSTPRFAEYQLEHGTLNRRKGTVEGMCGNR